jgi:two-component system response regulator MprA
MDRSTNDKEATLSLADLSMNTASHEVTRGGQPVSLTNTEYNLLQLLLEKPEQVHRRCDILGAVWGKDWPGDDNVLDVYIRCLRRKLEPRGSTTLIQTVRGVGFMLKEGAPRP